MSTTETALSLELISDLTVFDANSVDPLISRIREEALSLVADPETRVGREQLKSQAYKVSQAKTHLVKLANASVEQHRAIVTKVTSERDRIEAEQAKVAAEAERIAAQAAYEARKAKELADAKAASEEHRKRVRLEAAEDFTAPSSGLPREISTEEALLVVAAIEGGHITHVTLNF